MTAGDQALLRLARDEFARGRAAASRALCDEVLARNPDDAEGLHLLAVLELSKGDVAAALAPIERALRIDAGDAKKHHTRGLILRAQGRRDDAADAFREVLRLAPEFPEAHAGLAQMRMEEGELGEAARHFERALGSRPDVPAWLNDFGIALLGLARIPEAEASFRRCIALAPSHSNAWTNLGNALRRSGRAEQALAAYRRATQGEAPLAIAWVNLGNALRQADRLDEAMECFARATAIAPASPEAHFSRAIASLLTGELDRGWDEYRWRFGAPPDAGVREQVRGAIDARRPLEIRGEQGLGDALFFLRWAPALRSAGARLWFRGDARLFPLLERSGLFEGFVEEDAPVEDALALPGGDLPWVTQSLAVSHPPAFPLRASSEFQEAARRLLEGAGPPPYIGVAWRAGLPSTGSAEHLHKMVPLEAMGAALQRVPGTIVSLQRGAEAAELAALTTSFARPVLDAGGLNADLDAMLGLLAGLDEYAGVSSTNVHLRAGLGASARILVPAPGEWRYGRAGAATPWFAGFTLYREDRENGWTGALDTLAADLLARGTR